MGSDESTALSEEIKVPHDEFLDLGLSVGSEFISSNWDDPTKTAFCLSELQTLKHNGINVIDLQVACERAELVAKEIRALSENKDLTDQKLRFGSGPGLLCAKWTYLDSNGAMVGDVVVMPDTIFSFRYTK